MKRLALAVDIRGEIHWSFRPTAIAQLLVGTYYAEKAAHPLDYVSTLVIDSRTAGPITLGDLFTDEQAGLRRLSEQSRALLPTIGGGSGPESPGTRPIAENFANWMPTAQGLEIHFADYQVGHGLPVVTVPWSAIADLLTPAMQPLAAG